MISPNQTSIFGPNRLGGDAVLSPPLEWVRVCDMDQIDLGEMHTGMDRSIAVLLSS